MTVAYLLRCWRHARLRKHHHCRYCDQPIYDTGMLVCEACCLPFGDAARIEQIARHGIDEERARQEREART